jgi:protein involved in polysaccharide export with SLBB domain
MKSLLFKIFPLFLLGLFAAGCIPDSVNVFRARNEGHPPPPPKKENIRDDNYRTRRLDLIGITCLEDSSASIQVAIDPEGCVDLYRLNRINVVGLTTHEIKNLLAKLYEKADILKDPHFTVVVIRAAPRMITLMGFVGRPGELGFNPEEGITFVQAITRAGGVQGRGNPRSITLRRYETKIVNGKEQKTHKEYDISYKRIQNGYDDDFEIAEGDWIIVYEDLV